METYYLLTSKTEQDLPSLKLYNHNFIWSKHPIYPNIWVTKTVYSQNTMFKLVYGPSSLMCISEDILLEKVSGLNRVDPNSFGTLY
jgi:hypothetical protein